MKKWLIHIAFILILFGCEEETNWNIKAVKSTTIVVEGILTSENMQHSIKLTQTKLTLNENPAPISNAVIHLSDGEIVLGTTEYPPGSGIYYADQPFQALLNKIYYLHIEYENEIYIAADYMVPVTPLQELVLHNHWKYSSFYGITIQESNIPSMIEYYLDWTHFERFDTLYDGTGKAKMLYFTLNTIDVAEIFKPEKENIYFPEGTQIIRKKYSLSPQHQEFVRSLLSETEWRGGYFDVLPGNTITNISNDALGYFGVCAVTTDTLYASDLYLK